MAEAGTGIDLERLAINVVRGLSMDAPHAARSGHQGTAMALAPLAHVLWTRVMRYDPAAPDWPDRDRPYTELSERMLVVAAVANG